MEIEQLRATIDLQGEDIIELRRSNRHLRENLKVAMETFEAIKRQKLMGPVQQLVEEAIAAMVLLEEKK